MKVTGGVADSGNIPTLCGSNAGQHLIYSAIPNFPARLSVVVDTQVGSTGTGQGEGSGAGSGLAQVGLVVRTKDALFSWIAFNLMNI